MSAQARWIPASVIILVTTFANAQMSPEERAVRMAYTKLIFAAEMGTLHHALDRNHIRRAKHEPLVESATLLAEVEEKRLGFELSNFKVGNIRDLANTLYSDHTVRPDSSHRMIAVGGAQYSYKAGKDEFIDTAVSVNVGNWASTREDWDIPMRSVVEHMENHEWYSRYATYIVTVRFQGQPQSSKSMFFFGSDGKEQKQFAFDFVTQVEMVAVKQGEQWMYPRILFTPRYRSYPGVSEWLRSKADPDCPSGGVCCNPETMKCTLPKVDVDNPSAKLHDPNQEIALHSTRNC
jgi:hypothetical protein